MQPSSWHCFHLCTHAVYLWLLSRPSTALSLLHQILTYLSFWFKSIINASFFTSPPHPPPYLCLYLALLAPVLSLSFLVALYILFFISHVTTSLCHTSSFCFIIPLPPHWLLWQLLSFSLMLVSLGLHCCHGRREVKAPELTAVQRNGRRCGRKVHNNLCMSPSDPCSGILTTGKRDTQL